MAVKAYFADRAEGNYAVGKGKQSVVMAKANVLAGNHGGTPLADYYLAGFNDLARIELNAKVFWL